MRPAAGFAALFFVLIACDRTPVEEIKVRSGDTAELRVVTLAPHLAELVFAVGAGDLLVGVSSFTDFPTAALGLPVVSDAFITDREKLALLQPNLLLAWESGTPAHVIDELRDAGFRVEVVRSTSLADVASAIEQVGLLTGRAEYAAGLAETFRREIALRRTRYAAAEPIRIFYQVSMRPLYTVNSDHYISELISVCGGHNIFSDLRDLAPMIAVEAVIERDPEALLAGDAGQSDTFEEWQRWPQLAANRFDNHFLLSASELARPTPRLLQAADAICAALESARQHREQDVEAE